MKLGRDGVRGSHELMQAHIDEIRASGGTIGGRFEGTGPSSC
jgi:hypothetical protein